MITTTVFFISVFMIVYVYIGYPAVVFLLSRLKRMNILKADSYQPDVSLLIAAHNEEEHIEATLRNKLALNYPAEKLRILVVSDGSTDRTDLIVKKYEAYGVTLLRQEPRAGKTAALNIAARHAQGDILVFSDANSLYEPDAVAMLVRNFHDPSVGYVTGKMIYTDPDGTTIGDGCSTYMKYENLLRSLETRLGSIVGVDGGIDAVRRCLYQPMSPDQLPDFVLPLKVVEQGYRVVYEPQAILREQSLTTPHDEYRMRVRVSLRSLWALNDMRHLLLEKDHMLFAWQLWSHKVLRYLCFVFLVGAYCSNHALLSEHGVYRGIFYLQTVVYVGALSSPLVEKLGFSFKLLSLIKYFVLLNLASAHACIKFMFRRRQVVWTPRRG